MKVTIFKEETDEEVFRMFRWIDFLVDSYALAKEMSRKSHKEALEMIEKKERAKSAADPR